MGQSKTARRDVLYWIGTIIGIETSVQISPVRIFGHTVTIQDVRFPGGKVMFERYEEFRAQLPQQARDLKLDHRRA